MKRIITLIAFCTVVSISVHAEGCQDVKDEGEKFIKTLIKASEAENLEDLLKKVKTAEEQLATTKVKTEECGCDPAFEFIVQLEKKFVKFAEQTDFEKALKAVTNLRAAAEEIPALATECGL